MNQSEKDLFVASMAGELLPLVQIHPNIAFAAALARKVEKRDDTHYGHENFVGAALRYLEKLGMLTSKKVKHPDGHPANVRLYAITPLGAFTTSLGQSNTPVALPKAA